MTTTPERYTDAIQAELRYLGSWPVSATLALGEVGTFDGRSFVRERTLADLGVEITARRNGSKRDLGYASGANVEVDAIGGASGPVHPGVSASGSARVKFKAKNAIVMRAEGCENEGVDRLDLLKLEIQKLFLAGRWKKEWVAVSEVVHADRVLALIARAKDAAVELGLGAGIDANTISLAEGQGRVYLARGDDGVLQETAEGTTPLFRALAVRQRPLGKLRVEQANAKGRARAAAEEISVGEYRF